MFIFNCQGKSCFSENDKCIMGRLVHNTDTPNKGDTVDSPCGVSGYVDFRHLRKSNDDDPLLECYGVPTVKRGFWYYTIYLKFL